MGNLLYKCASGVNRSKLYTKLNEIKIRFSNLDFYVGESIPAYLFNSFTKFQIEAKQVIYDKYEEDIVIYSEDILSEILAKNHTYRKIFSLVIDRNLQKIIGGQDCTIDKNEIKLETLFVENSYTGNKLGTWLVGAAILYAVENIDGVSGFVTNTHEKNIVALKTLSKYNFFFKISIESFLNHE